MLSLGTLGMGSGWPGKMNPLAQPSPPPSLGVGVEGGGWGAWVGGGGEGLTNMIVFVLFLYMFVNFQKADIAIKDMSMHSLVVENIIQENFLLVPDKVYKGHFWHRGFLNF